VALDGKMLDCAGPPDETGRPLELGAALTGENPFVYALAGPVKLLVETLETPRW
jgi:hypothetical protein